MRNICGKAPDFELLWSDKVGYVWLTIGVNPVYVDTGIRIESAADLCGRCLDDVATDVLYMTGNDHALEAADPLELAEIKRRWEPYINQPAKPRGPFRTPCRRKNKRNTEGEGGAALLVRAFFKYLIILFKSPCLTVSG